MDYRVRALREDEYPLLKEFLYLAVFVPEGVQTPPRSIVETPELQVYIQRFGEGKDDRALAAEAGGKVVGVIWSRIMDDYGHVDDDTPSLAISVRKAYRGLGIGKELLGEMLALLKKCGCQRVSLSVQKQNFAVRMYRKAGFYAIRENSEEYVMVCDLN